MDLFAAINRGVALSGVRQREERKHLAKRAAAVASTRAQWANALLVDETAAWMDLYNTNRGVLVGLATVLSLCAIAKEHDDGSGDAPDVRVIRGALSAIEQCGKAGAQITVDATRAIATAARMAKDITGTCTDAAIEHAARYVHNASLRGFH